jgi:glutamate-1-semialdehyde aminotransferase
MEALPDSKPMRRFSSGERKAASCARRLRDDDGVIDRERLHSALDEETRRFVAAHPRSARLYEDSRTSMHQGVPMPWMVKWPGGFPVFVARAQGCRVEDVDGHEYVDFCLGDTGAMTGHSPEATVRAVREQLDRGVTSMLPVEDALVVSRELGRRFGLPRWQFTLSATDANRNVLRYARHVTGRPKVLVFNYCYHGTVDECFATLVEGSVTPRRGSLGPPVAPASTTRIVEFNDIDALERELANGDVACVLTEPALTNVGIVLPKPEFHQSLRALTRAHDVVLVIDETHTISVGPGGYTRAHGLDPDVLVVGKPIGGGIPAAAFGLTDELSERIIASIDPDYAGMGGVGGTLAGNALSMAAMRATLTEVLTEDAYDHMISLGARWAQGAEAVFRTHGLDWQVTRLGCRAEYHFTARPPQSGAEAARLVDFELERFIHLFALNRGVMLFPFLNKGLLSPAHSAADIDLHGEVLDAAIAALQ